jgi:hypothetical protein
MFLTCNAVRCEEQRYFSEERQTQCPTHILNFLVYTVQDLCPMEKTTISFDAQLPNVIGLKKHLLSVTKGG